MSKVLRYCQTGDLVQREGGSFCPLIPPNQVHQGTSPFTLCANLDFLFALSIKHIMILISLSLLKVGLD